MVDGVLSFIYDGFVAMFAVLALFSLVICWVMLSTILWRSAHVAWEMAAGAIRKWGARHD